MSEPMEFEALKALESALEEEQSQTQAAHLNIAEQLKKLQEAAEGLTGQLEAHKPPADPASKASGQALQALKDSLAQLTSGEEDKARIAELEEALEKKGQSLEEAEKKLADADRERGEQTTAAAAARERVETLEGELSEAKKEAESAQEQANEATKALDDHQAQGQDSEQELTALKDAKTALDAELEEAKTARASLQTELEEAKAAHISLEDALKEAKAGSETELEELRAAKAALEEDVAGLRSHAEESESLRQELLKESEAAKEAQAKLEEQLAEAQQSKQGFEDGLAAAKADVEELQAQLEKSVDAAELETAKAELTQEQERATELEQKLKDEVGKGTKAVLAEQLTEALKEAEQANAELQAVRAELGQAANGAASAPAAEAANDRVSEEERIIAAAKQQGNGHKRSIGEILLDADVVSKEQLDEAVEEQKQNPNTHLGAILVGKGYAGEAAVAQALACQSGADFVRLAETPVSAEAAGLISERLAKQHICIPVSATNDSLVLVLSNPMDLVAIEDVERATDRKANVAVGTASEIRDAIGKYYWEPE